MIKVDIMKKKKWEDKFLELETKISQLQNMEIIFREKFDSINDNVERISENLRNINSSIPEEIASMKDNIEKISENLRNNNAELELNHGNLEHLNVQIRSLKKDKELTKNRISIEKKENVSISVDGKADQEEQYSVIDYFDFENHFRGSQEKIKKNQQQYLKYFSKGASVVDIGCGRGEFLELLKEAGYEAKGVDVYQEYVDYCQMQGLDVVQGDGIRFLSELKNKVDGIFVGQVVEHLKLEQLVELCNISYQQLNTGGCAIFETPNPTSLSIYTNAFYMDPSHIKPVHPLTLQYFLRNAGFEDTQILYTETSKVNVEIPKIDVGQASQSFNEVMDKIGHMLFGSQDYAIIARKK